MKMKQVLEKTGLTDRAVRLYISEGLIDPSISESWAGRRQIEFSEADADRLAQIGTLRRAGFSIPEIKELLLPEADVCGVAARIARRIEESVRSEERTLRALRGFLSGQDHTLAGLCGALSGAEEGALPQADTQPSPADLEKKRRILVICTAFTALALLLLAAVAVCVCLEFRYPRADAQALLLYIWEPLIAAINVALYCITQRRVLITKRFIVGALVTFFVSVLMFSVALIGVFIGAFGCFFSETDRPENYLQVDSYLHGSDPFVFKASAVDYFPEIEKLFPPEIPPSADDENVHMYTAGSAYPFTTKYYYRFSCAFDDMQFDLFAEWRLPETAFEEAKRAGASRALKIRQNGNWTCCYYKSVRQNSIWLPEQIKPENRGPYYFLLFAYNDSSHTVRYLACAGDDSDYQTAFFNSLVW